MQKIFLNYGHQIFDTFDFSKLKIYPEALVYIYQIYSSSNENMPKQPYKKLSYHPKIENETPINQMQI